MKTTRLLIALFCSLLIACGSKAAPPAPAPVAPKIERLTLNIRTVAAVNDGRSVRMLIRRVEAKQFLQETYAALVAIAEKPDSSLLSDQLLRPSTAIQLTLPLEAGSSVGVYFFYAQPQAEGWHLLIPARLGEVTVQAQQHAAYLVQ
jgi:predicted component of type VI protein secretion system